MNRTYIYALAFYIQIGSNSTGGRTQNVIKDVHGAAVDNDVDLLKAKTQPPVPAIVLSAKDANGLTALHKAAGLAHTRVVEYLLSVWPEAATERDATGKIPLHYAASAKNNDRCFNLLVQAGADEDALDNVSRRGAGKGGRQRGGKGEEEKIKG